LVASNVENADLNGANSFNEFVRQMYKREKLPQAEILSLLRANSLGWIADRVEAEEVEGVDDVPF
jgi:hypothetical protein